MNGVRGMTEVGDLGMIRRLLPPEPGCAGGSAGSGEGWGGRVGRLLGVGFQAEGRMK